MLVVMALYGDTPMVPWTYNNKEVTGHSFFDESVVGFIYKIDYSNGQSYVGSKLIRSMTKLKPTKEQLAIRKNYVRKEMRDKHFMKYIGSSEKTKGLHIISREILEVCSSRRALTYKEAYWLFHLKVLEKDNYINKNILGRFFKGNLV